jgi:hypothetical protein
LQHSQQDGLHSNSIPNFSGTIYGEVDGPHGRWSRSTEAPSENTCRSRGTSPNSDGYSRDSGRFQCLDCGVHFDKVFELEAHAKRRRHKPFECQQCLKRFSRRDACSRHTSLHSSSQGQHECRLCGKYRGRRAFKRKDHLLKHMRTMHPFPRWCPHINCTLNDRNDRPEQFRLQEDYDRHMKDCHGGEANTCSVPTCEKYSGKIATLKDR